MEELSKTLGDVVLKGVEGANTMIIIIWVAIKKSVDILLDISTQSFYNFIPLLFHRQTDMSRCLLRGATMAVFPDFWPLLSDIEWCTISFVPIPDLLYSLIVEV